MRYLFLVTKQDLKKNKQTFFALNFSYWSANRSSRQINICILYLYLTLYRKKGLVTTYFADKDVKYKE